jgi:hypothetical protein
LANYQNSQELSPKNGGFSHHARRIGSFPMAVNGQHKTKKISSITALLDRLLWLHDHYNLNGIFRSIHGLFGEVKRNNRIISLFCALFTPLSKHFKIYSIHDAGQHTPEHRVAKLKFIRALGTHG